MNRINENEQGKKCFIITPIGNEKSDTFRKAKGVIESAIKPVMKMYGFNDIKPAYEINVSGTINTQIINRIIEDDLVIVNLTGNNPNVMYELCLRHVVAKPIIHICENGTVLPFDIKDNRTVFYENDMLGVEELKEKIGLFLKEISYDKEYMDNPIYNAYKYGELLKKTQGTETNEILKLLMDILVNISDLKAENPIFASSYRSMNVLDESIYANNGFSLSMLLPQIDKSKFQELLEEREKYGMNVHQLANKVHVKSKTILKIAEEVGSNLDSPRSMLSHGDMVNILEYFL